MKRKLLIVLLVILLTFVLLWAIGFLKLGIYVFAVEICFYFGGIVCLFVNRLVKHTNWYRNVIPDMSNYPTNEWYRTNLSRNYQVVNIGSSSAKYALDYDSCGVKAFNWAEQPQSLYYGFCILKTYFSILKKDGTVIIPLGPFSGLDVDGKWPSDANDKYFYTLSPQFIQDFYKVAQRRKYPLFYHPRTSLKKLLKDDPIRVFDNEGCICSSFEKDAFQWVNNWKKEFGITDMEVPLSSENFQGQQKRIRLLSDIIDFCQERDLKVVIIIPPLHKCLSNLFSENFRQNYIYNFIDNANKNRVRFLNFMDDSRFQKDEYFYNAFLMNKKGASYFTKCLLTDLQII